MSNEIVAEGVAKSEAKKPRVTKAEFIKAHWASNNNAEVAAKTGLTVESVTTKASAYRAAGIPLKEFARGGGGPKSDPMEALRLLAELRGCSLEEVVAESEALKAKNEARKAERAAEKANS